MKLFTALFFLFCTTTFATDSTQSDLLYREAETAFIKNEFQVSLEKLNEYFAVDQSGTAPKTVARAHNLKGLIYFQLKNINAAVQEFDHAVAIALDNFPNTDPSIHLARYNLANAFHQVGRTEEANNLLSQIFPVTLDSDTRIRFYHLLGNVQVALNHDLEAVIAYLRAASQTKDPVLTNAFIQRAYTASKKLFLRNPEEDLASLSQFSNELVSSSPTEWTLRLITAKGQMYLGNHAEAADIAEQFLAQNIEHPLRNQALEVQEQVSRLSVVEPTAIGILMPLSGKFGKFGRLCLNASLLALGAFENMQAAIGSEKYRFVIKDAGDTAESALLAFDKLVFEDHVIGVIGPLLSKQGGAVAQKAQEYGVPLFSLSQRNEQSRPGSYFFPIALSPAQQIDIIVSYAMDVRGYKRFGIMAPSDVFGDEYVKLFWDAVEQRNGSIMAFERYPPKSTDFYDELKSMLGMKYVDARTLETEELKRRSDIFSQTLKARGLTRKRLLAVFEPKAVAQFDAVFIPDDPQVVGQIAPAFAVQDVNKLPFLGINSWNNPELLLRAGRYVQDALFVDAFFSQSADPKVKDFVSQFQTNFESVPGTLEVQSYDATRILLKALTESEPHSRAQLQRAIIGLGSYTGTSGQFNFSANAMTRSAYLLTVKNNSFVEVSQDAQH
jgi:ABC-type branched-subunit amino acid transport system substrate-binding protein